MLKPKLRGDRRVTQRYISRAILNKYKSYNIDQFCKFLKIVGRNKRVIIRESKYINNAE
jgi:hypothetical protein